MERDPAALSPAAERGRAAAAEQMVGIDLTVKIPDTPPSSRGPTAWFHEAPCPDCSYGHRPEEH